MIVSLRPAPTRRSRIVRSSAVRLRGDPPRGSPGSWARSCPARGVGPPPRRGPPRGRRRPSRTGRSPSTRPGPVSLSSKPEPGEDLLAAPRRAPRSREPRWRGPAGSPPAGAPAARAPRRSAPDGTCPRPSFSRRWATRAVATGGPLGSAPRSKRCEASVCMPRALAARRMIRGPSTPPRERSCGSRRRPRSTPRP